VKKLYFNVCLNLDKRDSEGKPEVIETPSDLKENPLLCYEGDILFYTYSVIENGAERAVATHGFEVSDAGMSASLKKIATDLRTEEVTKWNVK